ncbi:hypothetical protein WJX72_009572 [[Myrmecia] bisecta]|uniref:Transcription initiation factor TFIID subunit 12 domain-containing protein n=1 Tax=[Myrmecia] bisecta TaxID=41462 RepID=A0AAW1PGX8_9CHLO
MAIAEDCCLTLHTSVLSSQRGPATVIVWASSSCTEQRQTEPPPQTRIEAPNLQEEPQPAASIGGGSAMSQYNLPLSGHPEEQTPAFMAFVHSQGSAPGPIPGCIMSEAYCRALAGYSNLGQAERDNWMAKMTDIQKQNVNQALMYVERHQLWAKLMDYHKTVLEPQKRQQQQQQAPQQAAAQRAAARPAGQPQQRPPYIPAGQAMPQTYGAAAYPAPNAAAAQYQARPAAGYPKQPMYGYPPYQYAPGGVAGARPTQAGAAAGSAAGAAAAGQQAGAGAGAGYPRPQVPQGGQLIGQPHRLYQHPGGQQQVPGGYQAAAVPQRPPTEEELRMLPNASLQRIMRKVAGPHGELAPDVEPVLRELAEQFIGGAVSFGCTLAKRRKAEVVEPADVAVYLERTWHLHIPGFSGDAVKPYKRPAASELHRTRAAAVRRLDLQLTAMLSLDAAEYKFAPDA